MNETDKLNQNHDDRLRRMVAEDAFLSDNAEDFLSVVKKLQSWEVPHPTSHMTGQLVEKLLIEMPTSEMSSRRRGRALLDWWPLLLMRAQLQIVRGEIWAASALIMVLGTLVAITTYHPTSNSGIPIAVLAPVVAAVGIALLYDSEYEQMLEIENTTAATTRTLLLARLTLVFGFDLVLALVGSVMLALFYEDVLLWPMVMSWLAPMAFLSAFAFLLSIVSGDALAGSASGLVIWSLHVMLRSVPDPNQWIFALSLPGLSAPESQPLLLVAAVLLITVALWLVGQNERIIGETR